MYCQSQSGRKYAFVFAEPASHLWIGSRRQPQHAHLDTHIWQFVKHRHIFIVKVGARAVQLILTGRDSSTRNPRLTPAWDFSDSPARYVATELAREVKEKKVDFTTCMTCNPQNLNPRNKTHLLNPIHFSSKWLLQIFLSVKSGRQSVSRNTGDR